MKQNGQWLSHVCTRSNTGLASSRPSRAPPQLELDVRPVDVQLVRDDVAQRLAVDADDLVARGDARAGGERFRRDGDDAGGRHGEPGYGGAVATLGPCPVPPP